MNFSIPLDKSAPVLADENNTAASLVEKTGTPQFVQIEVSPCPSMHPALMPSSMPLVEASLGQVLPTRAGHVSADAEPLPTSRLRNSEVGSFHLSSI